MKKPFSPSSVVVKKMTSQLQVVNYCVAGVDVGDKQFDIAIYKDSENGFEVRTFGTFTVDLHEISTWLKSEGIQSVVMESTGVYWINLYLMLQVDGFEVYLVNAKHVKNVTGRKRDDTDAIWLQKLHSYGMLTKSFQPDMETRTTRTYVRERDSQIALSGSCTQRIQKYLELMNVKIHTVISDIMGKTGLLIVRAIVAGETDPVNFLKFKDGRIKASDEDIMKSLDGVWSEENRIGLQISLSGYDFHQEQIKILDHLILKLLINRAAKVLEGDITDITIAKTEDTEDQQVADDIDSIIENAVAKSNNPRLNLKKVKTPKKNQFPYKISSLLSIIAGVDLTAVPGISEVAALQILSEIGTDMSHWETSKNFCAWANLVPNTKISGGIVLSSKMEKRKNYVGQTFRMSSSTLSSNKGELGDIYRKNRAKLGKLGGVVATAHKMARIVYTMLRDKTEYDGAKVQKKQIKWKETKIAQLEKEIERLKKAS